MDKQRVPLRIVFDCILRWFPSEKSTKRTFIWTDAHRAEAWKNEMKARLALSISLAASKNIEQFEIE